MEINPVAIFHSPFKEKFGIPRQSGVVESLTGEIELLPRYKRQEALRGIEGFDYLWLIWEFNLNGEQSHSLSVRPPRLGGNEKVGVFASRSPFRPNPLGLSCVKVLKVDSEKGTLTVGGADLADGTPIFDIKPYIPYSDAHPGARGGFTDAAAWETLDVIPASLHIERALNDAFTPEQLDSLFQSLAQDPRPGVQKKSNPTRTFGLLFCNKNIKFHVEDDTLVIDEVC